jgi:hypothetical protein
MNYHDDENVETRDLIHLPEQKHVYTWGYDYTAQTEQTIEQAASGFDNAGASTWFWGVEFSFNLDLSLGYRAIFFSMWKYADPWLVINPNIFAELASHNWITF